MSTAILDQTTMIERDSKQHNDAARVQAYAEKLRRADQFRIKVFADMATETMRLCLDQLEDRFEEQGAIALDRPYLKVPEGIVNCSLPIHFGNLRLTFEKLLNNPFQNQELWKNIATWILKRLDAWNQEDQQPENIPLIWERAKDAKTREVSRENYLIELCSFYLVGRWIQQLNLSDLSLEALERVLGYEGNIIEDIDKLSQLQKEILKTLLERSGDNLLKPLAVPWQPSTLYLSNSSMDRTTISKSLLKLAARNLVQRLDYEEEVIPTTEKTTMRRTKAVRLTEIGVLVAEAYQNSTDYLEIKLPTKNYQQVHN